MIRVMNGGEQIALLEEDLVAQSDLLMLNERWYRVEQVRRVYSPVLARGGLPVRMAGGGLRYRRTESVIVLASDVDAAGSS